MEGLMIKGGNSDDAKLIVGWNTYYKKLYLKPPNKFTK